MKSICDSSVVKEEGESISPVCFFIIMYIINMMLTFYSFSEPSGRCDVFGMMASEAEAETD